ncbi:uncharacterized protein LOC134699375 [Mytilus trossulus]|uniref:uncharacterized protein LOC134699375 n=1 Tax=Mytilus trossulus TaxID=6551 RepID=UPI003007BD06
MNYEEKMIIAYEAVVSKKMSFKEACTKFKIPDSTLRDRVKKGNPTKGRRGKNATLDQNESEKLTNCIMMLMKQGYNYTIDELCTLSSQYVISIGKRKHDKPVTKHWFYLLCENFPKLKELRIKLTQMDRTQTRDLTRVSSFFSYLSSCVNKHDLSERPCSIYSLSSTELSYSWPYAIREVPSHEEAITLFICANGAGNVIPPWYVFPEGKSNLDINRLQEDCKPGFGFLAEERLFPSEIFLKYLTTHFLRHTLPQDHKILLVDGHDLYVSVEILEWAEKNQITLIVLPADEYKTIQPLQVDCLSSFERLLTENCKASVSGSQLDRSALCKAVSDAYQQAFTSEEIQRSFRMSKIFPISTEMI